MVRKYITETIIAMPDTAFVLAIKNDTAHVARQLSADSGKQQKIAAAYDIFCEGLNKAFETAFGADFELHIFDDIYVEAQQKLKASSYIAVSLDPCVGMPDAFSLGVSRHFREQGVELIGLDARPGFPVLEEQFAALKDYANGKPVALIEDDIFSGFTMLQTVEKLQAAGITVGAIIPGIQIGTLAAFANSDIVIDPVHKYTGTPEQMKRIDLTDYRDFLIGSDGLVIQDDEGIKSRVPFILPFTSPHIRISLPKAQEQYFSNAVWQLNADFYKSIDLRAGDMNPYSIAALNKLFPVSTDMLMRDVLRQYKAKLAA